MQLDALAGRESAGSSDLEYAVATAMRFVDAKRAAKMLQQRWPRLQARPRMVQAALLSTVPEAVELARAALDGSPHPSALLAHVTLSARMWSGGMQVLTSRAQLDNLIPHLDYFPIREIEGLWDVCRDMGWLDFRRKYLDVRLRKVPDHRACLPGDPVDTTMLDRALAGQLFSHFGWFEHQERRGHGREELMTAMLDWLQHKALDRALEVVRDVVGEWANRREFARFAAAVCEMRGLGVDLKAVRFEVFSRSLV